MKIKVGTQLEDEIYKELKVLAAKEKVNISDLLQTAVCEYLNKKKRKPEHRAGLKRFLESPPLRVSDEQFREIMELDYYDQ